MLPLLVAMVALLGLLRIWVPQFLSAENMLDLAQQISVNAILPFGMTLLIGIEAFVNMAVVMGLVPTKGMALPFLSYGGSSLMATLMAVGIILNVSSKTQGEVR